MEKHCKTAITNGPRRCSVCNGRDTASTPPHEDEPKQNKTKRKFPAQPPPCPRSKPTPPPPPLPLPDITGVHKCGRCKKNGGGNCPSCLQSPTGNGNGDRPSLITAHLSSRSIYGIQTTFGSKYFINRAKPIKQNSITRHTTSKTWGGRDTKTTNFKRDRL